MSTKMSSGKIKRNEMTTALRLVVGLGAYCPYVKLSEETALAAATAKAKRRTRPLLGRGGFGKNLVAMFAKKRMQSRKGSRMRGMA